MPINMMSANGCMEACYLRANMYRAKALIAECRASVHRVADKIAKIEASDGLYTLRLLEAKLEYQDVIAKYTAAQIAYLTLKYGAANGK